MRITASSVLDLCFLLFLSETKLKLTESVAACTALKVAVPHGILEQEGEVDIRPTRNPEAICN